MRLMKVPFGDGDWQLPGISRGGSRKKQLAGLEDHSWTLGTIPNSQCQGLWFTGLQGAFWYAPVLGIFFSCWKDFTQPRDGLDDPSAPWLAWYLEAPHTLLLADADSPPWVMEFSPWKGTTKPFTLCSSLGPALMCTSVVF